MSARNVRRARGFTLIEIMISCAIIGIMATIAAPSYLHATLRSRSVERSGLMVAIARSVGDLVERKQLVPGLAGAWNPTAPVGTERASMNPTMDGWKDLALDVSGATYYRYTWAVDVSVSPAVLHVIAVGDLDGDGVPSTRHMRFTATGAAFALLDDTVDDPNAW